MDNQITQKSKALIKIMITIIRGRRKRRSRMNAIKFICLFTFQLCILEEIQIQSDIFSPQKNKSQNINYNIVRILTRIT